MDTSNLTYPDGVSQPSQRRVAIIKKAILHSSEVCDGCFSRVRIIGDIVEIRTGEHIHERATVYERTDLGSQEHSPFETAADRYGTCFCEGCGSAVDDGLGRGNRSKEELTGMLRNAAEHILRHSDHDLSGERAGRTLNRLVAEPDNTGYDTELLVASLAVGLEDTTATISPSTATAD